MGQGYDGYWADIGIGEDAIIDKNARIGRNVHIRHQIDRPDSETDNGVARPGGDPQVRGPWR